MEERLCPSCEEPVIDKQSPCPLSCMSPKCKAYQRKPVVNIKEKPVIWIIGGPGAGKGTQCVKIREKYGYTHISIGDILRDEVKRGSDMSKCLETVMARGGLVPNDIVINIIKAAIAKFEPTTQGFIIDGYPREKEQGIAFEEMIAPVSAVLYLDVSRETLIKRLTKAAASSERFDDTEKAIKLRVQTFFENIHLILQLYEKKLYRISAEKSIDEIFKEIVKTLDPIAAAAKVAKATAAAASSSKGTT